MSQALNAGSKRVRKASHLQQEINNKSHAIELAKLTQAEKDLARKKKQLLKQHENAEDDDQPESQSESDEGFGKIAGGGFTSVISSQGIVHTLGTKALKKHHLLCEDDILSDPSGDMMRRPLIANGAHQTQSSPPPTTQPQHNDDLFDFDDHTNEGNDNPRPSSPSPAELGAGQIRRHDQSTASRSGSHHHDQSTAARSESPEHQRPPAKHVKLPPATFRNGKAPGKNPKASDFEEGVEKMLLNTSHEFACLIFTVNTFPDDETQIKWARAIWKNMCDKVDSHYDLSYFMIKLITERDSWARGLLKDAAREHFKDYYKFKKGSANGTKQYNLELHGALLADDVFHHKDTEAGTGFAESPIIADILETAFFEDSSDYGVQFSKYFNPISVNLLALLFTIIEFLIGEYATGEKVKAPFREKHNIERFEKHSKRIEEWIKLNKEVTTNIRAKLFKKLMKRAGALQGEPLQVASGMTESMREKAQQALNGRTGETDSEAE